MEENGSVSPYQQQVRKQGAVPFLWEEKPGTPKKECKLDRVQGSNIPPPVKLVTSVPFKWEEKPGKPLNCFTHPQGGSPLLPLPPARLRNLPSPLVYSPSSSPCTASIKWGNMFWRSRCDEDGSNSDDDDEKEEDIFEMGFEAISTDIDESFRGSPSLLANGLLPTGAISNAIPASEYSVKEHSSVAEGPGSPVSGTGSNTTSHATGTTNLMNSSFLDCLFPLSSPNSGFLDKVGYHEGRFSPTLPPQIKESGYESNHSLIVRRRTPTLGELIRMSYRSKSIHIQKQSPRPDFIKKRVLGCCIF